MRFATSKTTIMNIWSLGKANYPHDLPFRFSYKKKKYVSSRKISLMMKFSYSPQKTLLKLFEY